MNIIKLKVSTSTDNQSMSEELFVMITNLIGEQAKYKYVVPKL